MTKWEYKIFAIDPNEAFRGEPVLNGFGSEGWEVVSCFLGNKDGTVQVILKRPK